MAYDFKESNSTHFNKGAPGSFEEMLQKMIKPVMTDARKRMLKQEDTFFGFIAAPSVDSMDRLNDLIGHASLSELQENLVGSEFPQESIRGTGCYFLKEDELASGVIQVTARVGDYLGFISMRNPGKPKQKYSLGRTSRALGTPVFTSANGGPVIISGETSIDVVPGRLHLGYDGTDAQALRINDENSKDHHMQLRLTGRYRRPSVQAGPCYANSRGASNGPTYHSDYVADSTEWTDAKDPKFFYDLDVKIVGTRR